MKPATENCSNCGVVLLPDEDEICDVCAYDAAEVYDDLPGAETYGYSMDML